MLLVQLLFSTAIIVIKMIIMKAELCPRISICGFSLSRLHQNSYRCTGVLVPRVEPLLTVLAENKQANRPATEHAHPLPDFLGPCQSQHTCVKRLPTRFCRIPKRIPSFLFFFFADNCSHLLCFPGLITGRRYRLELSCITQESVASSPLGPLQPSLPKTPPHKLNK